MKKKSRVDLILEQARRQELDESILNVEEKPKSPKPVITAELKPTKIKPAKTTKEVLSLINKLQDEHYLILLHSKDNKLYWCEGHHKYLSMKECPIRTLIGPSPYGKPERYVYVTTTLHSFPK